MPDKSKQEAFEPFTANAAMFEGLFLSHPLEGDFRRDVLAAGYDPTAVTLAYPMPVWVACLDLIHQRRFPTLARYEAWSQIGRGFIEGYFATFVGGLIAVVLPLVSARRFLDRVPSYVRTGLPDTFCSVTWPSASTAVLTMNGPHEGASAFMSGVLYVCLSRLDVEAAFSSEVTGPVQSRLTIGFPRPQR